MWPTFKKTKQTNKQTNKQTKNKQTKNKQIFQEEFSIKVGEHENIYIAEIKLKLKKKKKSSV